MPVVFIVQHVAREDTDDEDVKLVGVYSSRAKADAAVARLLAQRGFGDYPTGFHIGEHAMA